MFSSYLEFIIIIKKDNLKVVENLKGKGKENKEEGGEDKRM
jgi:hypothetical protein